VITVTAQRQQNEALRSRVHELPTHFWRDADEVVTAENVLDPLNQQGQLTLEYQVYLLLVLVSVDPQSLARLEQHEIHPKGMHTERAPQRMKALTAVAL
jgi:hypothetical protein